MVVIVIVVMTGVIVPVAARAVRMPVRELLFGRRAHVDDLDLEHQRLARERMIQVQVDVEMPHLHDARVARAVARVHGHHLARRELALRLQMLDRHALHGIRIVQTVAPRAAPSR